MNKSLLYALELLIIIGCSFGLGYMTSSLIDNTSGFGDYTTVTGLTFYNSFDVDNYTHYTDKYYCVWTKGRSSKDIADTEVHEQCHVLVLNDYHHFCEDI